MKYTVNKPKVDIGSYRHYWRGTPKVGKTTMFRDLILSAYGSPEYGFLISLGNEYGHEALNNVVAVKAEAWKDFIFYVDDLVKNKADNNFKLIALDTVDQLVAIARKRVYELHREIFKWDAKSDETLMGGFGKGNIKISEIITEQLNRLQKSGYGLVFIGHTKEKGITEDDTQFSVLVGSLPESLDKIFLNIADIFAMICEQHDVVKGTGKLDQKDDIIKNAKIDGVSRYVYFRSEDGTMKCGSRFPHLPERVELLSTEYHSADEYLKAFNAAVAYSAQIKTDELKKAQEDEAKEKEKVAEQYRNTEPKMNDVGEVVDEEAELQEKIMAICKKHGKTGTNNPEIMPIVRKYSVDGNPRSAHGIETLTAFYNELVEFDNNQTNQSTN